MNNLSSSEIRFFLLYRLYDFADVTSIQLFDPVNPINTRSGFDRSSRTIESHDLIATRSSRYAVASKPPTLRLDASVAPVAQCLHIPGSFGLVRVRGSRTTANNHTVNSLSLSTAVIIVCEAHSTIASSWSTGCRVYSIVTHERGEDWPEASA